MWGIHLFTEYTALIILSIWLKSQRLKRPRQLVMTEMRLHNIWTVPLMKKRFEQKTKCNQSFLKKICHLAAPICRGRHSERTHTFWHLFTPDGGNLGLSPQRLGSGVTTERLQPITTQQRAGRRYLLLIWSLSPNVTFSTRGSLPSQDADQLIIPFSHRLSNKHPASRWRGSRTD